MKHSAHVQLRHVLFTQWMEISLNISHPEGSGLLHVLVIHMSVSLLSMGKSIQNPTAAAKTVTSLYDAVQMPLYCGRSDPSTHSELSISLHSHPSILMSIHVFIFIFYEHSSCQTYLARANWLFFLTKSNVTVISENVPVYWMSVSTRTCPS